MLVNNRDTVTDRAAAKPASQAKPQNAERARLAADAAGEQRWKRWGPYLSERQWGTVREDYSPYGNAWDYFPHDQARSRAYRWGEDGLAGISDDTQRLCLALALWNGRDPILKERLFGLTNGEGNHGEDVKELYYYLDATPTHSYLKYLYKYPQREFPYAWLVEENRRRGKDRPEFELIDTGVFDDDRYFDVFVEYAKAAPEDVLMLVTVHNRGPETATIHVLPQLWFRNIWSWVENARRPGLLTLDAHTVGVQSKLFGDYRLYCDGEPTLLFCDNDSNLRRLYGFDVQGHFKDAFHEFLVQGREGRGQSGAGRDQGGRALPARAAAGRLGYDSAPARQRRAEDALRRLRSGARAAARRSGRVLCRAAGRARRSGRPERPAPGLRRHDLVEAVLPLRHAEMAERRSEPAAPAARAAPRPQLASGCI